MQRFFILVLLKVLLQEIAVAQTEDNTLFPKLDECGKLNVDYFYNRETVTELDEFPWIARIGFEVIENVNPGPIYKCLGVLIGKRHVLSLAQCFRYDVPLVVALGDWDMSNDVTEKDCNKNGDCAPLPVQYEVEEVAIHPGYNHSNAGTNDIALIRLTAEVIFTDHIQPICMPPNGAYTKNLVPHYFNVAGFDYLRMLERNRNAGQLERIKSLVQAVDKEHCVKALNPKPQTDNVICTTCVTNGSLMSGSTLMGVLMENSKPSRFYLLGLMSAGGGSSGNECKPRSRQFFTEVSTHINWIKYNM